MKILNEVKYYNVSGEDEFEIKDLDDMDLIIYFREMLASLDQSNKLQITTDTYIQKFTILEK